MLVIGPAEQQELIAARRASLLRLKAAHESDEQPIMPIADELLPPTGGVNPNSARGRTG